MKILNFLKHLHDECLRLLPLIKFDKSHKLHFALLSLYGSQIELTGAIVILMDSSGRLAIPSLLRTLLETYVDFHNLIRDPAYGYYLDASYLSEWLRILNAAQDTPNPYLHQTKESSGLAYVIEKYEKELNDLKERGYKPLSIQKKFDKAEMINEYNSLYNFLCTEAHSNKRALIYRHAEIHNNDYELVVYMNGPDIKYVPYLDSAAGMLYTATKSIHEMFETGTDEVLLALHNTLDEIRVTYGTEIQ